MPIEIEFREEKVDYMLDLFGSEVDDDGYIIDRRTGERVRSTEGEALKKDDLGFVGLGSTYFVEDDISSLTEFLRQHSE